NCDTMRKARAWLDQHGVNYAFHDYKKDGIDAGRLGRWCGEAGWEKLLNRSGTTFRKLPEDDKRDLDRDKAVQLMLAQPSIIKRPVIEADTRVLIGFDPDVYARVLLTGDVAPR